MKFRSSAFGLIRRLSVNRRSPFFSRRGSRAVMSLKTRVFDKRVSFFEPVRYEMGGGFGSNHRDGFSLSFRLDRKGEGPVEVFPALLDEICEARLTERECCKRPEGFR